MNNRKSILHNPLELVLLFQPYPYRHNWLVSQYQKQENISSSASEILEKYENMFLCYCSASTE